MSGSEPRSLLDEIAGRRGVNDSVLLGPEHVVLTEHERDPGGVPPRFSKYVGVQR